MTNSVELCLCDITLQAMILLISRYFNLSCEITALHNSIYPPLVKEFQCYRCVSIAFNEHFKNECF